MMKKRIKLGSALILTAALAFSAFVLPKVYAANPVDTGAACSITVDVTDSAYKHLNGKWTEAEKQADAVLDKQTYPVTINLYKVADITMEGKYKAIAAMENATAEGSSKTFGKMLEDLGEDLTANDWESITALAKAQVDAGNIPLTASETVTGTNVTIDETETGAHLGTGLYLIDVPALKTSYYEYSFAPGMVSLPNNYFYTTNDDTWVYTDVEVTLKPARTELYGDLVIEKTVEVFDATYPSATFVFQVEATKEDPDAAAGTEAAKVFSDVFAMEFTGPGTRSLTVGKIPAGAVVTVTEVYTGASYTVDQAEETTVIIADDHLDAEKSNQACVSFTNTHDGRTGGGNGIVNRFSYDDGQWTYEAASDSIPKSDNQ